VGMGLLSLDGRVLRVNLATCAISGYTEAELMQRTDRDNVHPADRDLDAELAQQLVHGERDTYVVEKRYVRKNGEVFWARVNLSLVRDNTGQPAYLVGMMEDIDDQKRAAERLAAQDAEHRLLLEQRVAQRTEELKQINQLLQQKAAQEAVVNERTRLARDLHDAVTQTLFAATLIADVLPDIWKANQTEGHRRLEELRQLTRGALAEMRTLLVELRPNALVETPLSTLLRQLTEALGGRARVNIQLNIEGDCPLPPDVKIALYRIAQEALNNVIKHARAPQAILNLRFGKPLRLTLADNGSGFNADSVTGDHLGLKIMRERAEAIGAKLNVYSELGEGTQVSVLWEEAP
ncbi:MAG: PAS domain S-box protein, partial [Anaerolineales bacterium]|nr:PAS domain S-box protein [Anaerolineales bacterium]